MADAHGEAKHPYHLVDPSPWPLVGSLSAVVMAVGAVAYMHEWQSLAMGTWMLPVGTVLVLFTMFMWWRDVVGESVIQKLHTPVVKIGLRYGMALFIASEVMFFVAFFWAYFDASLFVNEAFQVDRVAATGGVWPPEGVKTFDPFDLPLLNTLILRLSGCTVTWAHHALLENDRKGLVRGLACTVILGVLFTALQAYEYSHAAFGFADNIYSSTFYMATGFHGFHVLIGTLFLAVCLFRSIKGHFSPQEHVGFEAAAWYWHFVDVVWLFLFGAIYIWGA